MDNHARTVARSYLQRVAEAVGAVAQAKEESWSYATPRIHGEVASVAIGLDGTCKLLCEQGWREAMTGTISLYDGEEVSGCTQSILAPHPSMARDGLWPAWRAKLRMFVRSTPLGHLRWGGRGGAVQLGYSQWPHRRTDIGFLPRLGVCR